MNQTKHCWQNYVDYHKCILAKGEDFAPCRQFWLAYRSLCPSGWYQRWDEQRGAIHSRGSDKSCLLPVNGRQTNDNVLQRLETSRYAWNKTDDRGADGAGMDNWDHPE